jgi:dihydroorotase-like cyclic amidohydrolase
MQNCDSNIYEGIKTFGAPEYVIVNGSIVFEKEQLFINCHKGKYLQ